MSRSGETPTAVAATCEITASIPWPCSVAPVETKGGKWVHADNIVRADTSVERLAKLRPVFAKDGTLTAGNSSALTDGAASVLLMSEEKAKALGVEKVVFDRAGYAGS